MHRLRTTFLLRGAGTLAFLIHVCMLPLLLEQGRALITYPRRRPWQGLLSRRSSHAAVNTRGWISLRVVRGKPGLKSGGERGHRRCLQSILAHVGRHWNVVDVWAAG